MVLTDSPAGQWQVDGGWQWNPNDGGVVGLTMCAPQGSFVQRNVVMPPASTEPLALVMSYQGSSGTQGFAAKVGQAVVVTDALQSFAQTRAYCLGEGAMTNGPTTVEVRTASIESGSCFGQSVTLDQLEIVPARSLCPAIGAVMNGDLEGAGGWWLSGTAAIVSPAIDSTRGLRLNMSTECDSASAATLVSTPLASSLPNAALRFKARGTSGSMVEVTAGPSFASSARLARITTTGTLTTHSICLSSALAGNVAVLSFALRHVGPTTCTTPEPRTVELDDVQLVSDPACAGGEVGNGGFETTDGAPWILSTSTPLFSSAAVIVSPTLARNGLAFWRASTAPCTGSTTEQLVKVPAASAGAGPAVRFFYRRIGLTGSAGFFLQPGNYTWNIGMNLPPAPNWTRTVVCLPPSRAGFPASLNFGHSGGPGTCGSPTIVERLDLDDVEVTTDSSCPP